MAEIVDFLESESCVEQVHKNSIVVEALDGKRYKKLGSAMFNLKIDFDGDGFNDETDGRDAAPADNSARVAVAKFICDTIGSSGVNLQDKNGATALGLAAENSETALVQLLVTAGADPSLPDAP